MAKSLQNMLTRLSAAGTATSSRYSVQIALPSFFLATEKKIGGLAMNDVLDFYCESITTPTKQMTTAQHRDHGVGINYVTGTVYGEVTMEFLSPKNLDINRIFERWFEYMHNDYGNQVAYYDEVVAPDIWIAKLEKGRFADTVTGVWHIENALPYNITPFQLSAGRTNLLKYRVSFKFERYRFEQSSKAFSQFSGELREQEVRNKQRRNPWDDGPMPDLSENQRFFNSQTTSEQARLRQRYGID